LGLDPRKPYVNEDDTRFEKVQDILAQFGGIVPPPPLPPRWKGRRPLDYDGTLAGIGRWLEFELQQIVSDKIFCNGENASLLHLNEVIGNAYLVFNYLGIDDPPKRLPRAKQIDDAAERIENLAVFVRGKIKKGGQSEQHEQAISILSDGSRFQIARWADLGIGIDENGYHAFSPCPLVGKKVKLHEAASLKLPGTQWRALLDCLARSSDGRTVERRELALEFGYFKKGNVSWKEVTSEDSVKMEKAEGRVTSAMANLGRRIRERFITEDKTIIFEANDPNYVAAFTTRHLVRDDDRNVCFGEPK
jgi:hypothetical protein